MKLLGLLLAVFVASTSAASVDWRLKRAYVEGLDGDMLLVETTLAIRWDSDVPLELIAWANLVDAGIEVRDDKGHRLEDVVTTGPAPAFQKNVVLKRGESRTFEVITGTFVLVRSGVYKATGRLQGKSPDGKVVVLDLGKLEFDVEMPAKERPNSERSAAPERAAGRGLNKPVD